MIADDLNSVTPGMSNFTNETGGQDMHVLLIEDVSDNQRVELTCSEKMDACWANFKKCFGD